MAHSFIWLAWQAYVGPHGKRETISVLKENNQISYGDCVIIELFSELLGRVTEEARQGDIGGRCRSPQENGAAFSSPRLWRGQQDGSTLQ